MLSALTHLPHLSVMHATVLGTVIGVTAAIAPSAFAQAPQDSSELGELGKLADIAAAIKRLHSDKFRVRQDAHEQLLKSGVDAIGSLESATQSRQPEVAARALQIIVELGRDKSSSDQALAALERIANQKGNPVSAKAAVALVDLKMTDADRALVALQAAGARISGMRNGEVFSATVASDAELALLTHLPKVRSVSIRGNATDVGVKHLADVKGLNRLSISDSLITSVGLAALKGVSDLESLTLATFRNPQFRAEDLHVLQHLPKLDRLSLHGVQGSLLFLLDLKRLDSLSLSQMGLSDENIATINQLKNLRRVSLSLTQAVEEDLRRVSEIELALTLSVMSPQAIRVDAWRHLRGKQIQSLTLGSGSTTNAVLSHIGKITSLESLIIINGDITDEGLAHLHGLKSLRSLTLLNTKVTAEGLAELQRVLPNLDRAQNRIMQVGANILPRNEIAFTDDPVRDGRNAHLRERLTPQDIAKLKKETQLLTVFVGDKLQDADMQMLNTVKMRGIVVNSPLITDQGLRSLKDHPTLEEIALWKSSASDAAIKTMGQMEKLTSVKLQEHPFSDDALRALIGQLAKHGKIKTLSLFKTSITSEGLQEIHQLATLEQLFLNNNDGVNSEILGKIATLSKLKRLEIDGIALSDEALLQPLTQLKSLETLGLSNPSPASLSNRGLAYLSRIASLKSLTIDGANVDDDGMTHLAKLSKLERLTISNTGVTDRGIQRVADKLPGLTRLGLAGTKVTNAGMAHMAKLGNLEWLWLSDTRVGDQGLTQLDGLKALRHVQLSADRVSPNAEQRFKRQHPRARLMLR